MKTGRERIESFMELEKSKLNRKIDQALFDTLVQLPPWVRALPALDSRSPLRDCLEKFGYILLSLLITTPSIALVVVETVDLNIH